MRKRRPRSSPVESLRLAIDCLPVATREAMLASVRGEEKIIAGAYVGDDGGVCPMLAAHRRGARTGFLSFARAWDRFTRVHGASRAATTRELTILRCQLEASLAEAGALDLDGAIAEHRALRGRRMARSRAMLAEADPRGEISARRVRPYRPSPGRRNMISGIRHAGESLSR